MGSYAGPAAGVAVILAGILAIMIWKGVGKKSVHWLALFTGLTGSYIVVGYLGSLATYKVYGTGVVTLVIIFGGLLFWLEVVKGKKPHKHRTPLTALALGVALMAGNGGVQHVVQHATTNGTRVVSHVSNSIGGGG